jgi:TATA-box binding protein (TBP) (component of TFIID and TFIIIB)
MRMQGDMLADGHMPGAGGQRYEGRDDGTKRNCQPDNQSPLYSTHQWDVAPDEAYLAIQRIAEPHLHKSSETVTNAAGLHKESLECRAGTASAHVSEANIAAPCQQPAARPCRHLVEACRRSHLDASGKPVKFGTMSFKCRLNHYKVDLRILANHIPGGNALFRASGFTSLHGGAKDHSTRATFLIRLSATSSRTATIILCPNGSIQVFGTSSYQQCVRALRKFLHRLQRTSCCKGRPAVQYPREADIEGNLSVELVKRDFDLGVGLVIERVISVLRGEFEMDYNNEMYAGLKVKASSRATVIVFHTGRAFVTVTGSGDKASAEISAEVEDAYKSVCGRIWAHIKEVANMTTLRREPRSKKKTHKAVKQALGDKD